MPTRIEMEPIGFVESSRAEARDDETQPEWAGESMRRYWEQEGE